ncbi:MAG: hypothetical protein NTV16_02605 [Actinobacteria bacterium]|nr:hypothetical protein [Actinomycetota bacterium]
MLELDLEESRKNIIDFIRKHATDLNKQGAVVRLSGGIDSALVFYALKH